MNNVTREDEMVFVTDPDRAGEGEKVEFHMIFVGQSDKGEADLTVDKEIWEALGKPEVIHAYAA